MAGRVRGLGAAVLEFASDAALRSRSLVLRTGDSFGAIEGPVSPVDGPVLDSVTGWRKPLSMQRTVAVARCQRIASTSSSKYVCNSSASRRSKEDLRERDGIDGPPDDLNNHAQGVAALLASALCFSPPCFMLR